MPSTTVIHARDRGKMVKREDWVSMEVQKGRTRLDGVMDWRFSYQMTIIQVMGKEHISEGEERREERWEQS